jgi:hypothetical protein
MFIEIRKHNLRKDGEDDIYETVPAICLGVVQNYTYTDGALEFRGPLDESPGAPMPDISAMMLVKKACEKFTEKYVDEISGVVYKQVYSSEADATADSFCNAIKVDEEAEAKEKSQRSKSKPAKKKKTAKAQPKKEAPTEATFQKFLDAHDKDGSISALLSMEKDSPEKMLPDEDQASIKAGTPQVRCSVCKAAVGQVLKRAKAKKGRAMQDEGELADLVSDICVGQPSCENVQARLLDRGSTSRVSDSNCVPEGVYPAIPGNPPAWAAYYRVLKSKEGRCLYSTIKNGIRQVTLFFYSRWKLGKAKKNKAGKYPKMGRRGMTEEQHTAEVIKNTMISQACKQSFDNEDSDMDLSEIIFKHKADTSKSKVRDIFCASSCESTPATAAKSEL